MAAFVWAAGAAGAASPAQAADPAPVLPSTPEAVPAAVAAAVNALSTDARPCELMTRGLREHVAVRELLAHEPVTREPWSPEQVTRLCDDYVVRETGNGVGIFEDRGGWVRTEIGPARVVQARGDVAHLRARVTQRYTREAAVHDSEEVVDLYVAREDGTWRIASLEQLLELDLSSGGAPETIAEFEHERREQDALTRTLLRAHARMVRELATVPQPLAHSTIRCRTGADAQRSGLSDPVPDVRRIDGRYERVRRPSAARVDMVDVRLRTGRGRMCWTIRLRGRPADRLDISFLLAQDRAERVAAWGLRLEGGRAVGLRGGAHGVAHVLAVRASARGRVVRVVMPARRVRGQVRTSEPFGWSATAHMPDPDRAPGSTVTWVDSLPALQTLDDLAGIRHR